MKTPGVSKTAGVAKINVGSGFETDCAAAMTFARIAALSPPTLPPGVAERIIRDVPRLAQMPAPCSPMRAGSVRAPAPVRVVTRPQVRGAAAGRRPVAGWTALAAGIAAIALLLPMAFPGRDVTHAPPPRQLAQNQLVQNRTSRARIVPVPVLATKSLAARLAWKHSVWGPAPVNRDSGNAMPIVAEPGAEPAPVQIAVAVAAAVAVSPPRLVYGPVDTEARPSSIGSLGAGMQGGIGPDLTGYAFTNRDPGMGHSGASGAHPR